GENAIRRDERALEVLKYTSQAAEKNRWHERNRGRVVAVLEVIRFRIDPAFGKEAASGRRVGVCLIENDRRNGWRDGKWGVIAMIRPHRDPMRKRTNERRQHHMARDNVGVRFQPALLAPAQIDSVAPKANIG